MPTLHHELADELQQKYLTTSNIESGFLTTRKTIPRVYQLSLFLLLLIYFAGVQRRRQGRRRQPCSWRTLPSCRALWASPSCLHTPPPPSLFLTWPAWRALSSARISSLASSCRYACDCCTLVASVLLPTVFGDWRRRCMGSHVFAACLVQTCFNKAELVDALC